jgi:hypothetical protein
MILRKNGANSSRSHFAFLKAFSLFLRPLSIGCRLRRLRALGQTLRANFLTSGGGHWRNGSPMRQDMKGSKLVTMDCTSFSAVS